MRTEDVLYRAFQIGSQLRAETLKGPDITDTFNELDIELISEVAAIQFEEVIRLLSYYMVLLIKNQPQDAKDISDIFQAIAIRREEVECIITFLIAVNLQAITPNLDISENARQQALNGMKQLRKQTESVDELYDVTENYYPWSTLTEDEWGQPMQAVEEHHSHDWWIGPA